MSLPANPPPDGVTWESLHHELEAIKGIVRTDISDMETRVSAQITALSLRFDSFTKEITDHARKTDVLTTQLAADGRALRETVVGHAGEIECLYDGLETNKTAVVDIRLESARGDKRAMIVGTVIAAAFTAAGVIIAAAITAQAAGAAAIP